MNGSRMPLAWVVVTLAMPTLLVIIVLYQATQRTVLLDDPGAPMGSSSSLPEMRIDINSAGVAELAMLPSIGPALAERIVGYRQQHGPFATVDDLHRVSGIGPATLDRIRPMAIALKPADAAAATNK
jgi:competence ComEA-like helix-hairpin-helix protein